MPEPEMKSSPPVKTREIVGWAFFDFANSSYTTVIVTVGFGVYYTKLVVPGEQADFLWSLGIFLSNLIVMLTAPVIGAMADDVGRKKLFLLGTTLLCVTGTAALYFVSPGLALVGLVLFVISNLGFAYGENLVAAFLPEISTPKNVGRISGFGWGLGYFGGLLCLIAVRPLLAGGFELDNLANLRLAWLATAVFFLVAAIPTFAFLRERAPRGPRRRFGAYFRISFERIATTARALRHFSELARFLLVFFVFSCGLMTVIAFAGIYAERTIGYTPDELIGLFISLQVSSAAGAFIFGFVQDRLGARRTIQVTLVLWILVCVGAYVSQSKGMFLAVAMAAGLGIGSLQSASRGMVGLFSPVEKSGEFFAFWGFAGKGAYTLGPLVFGVISSASGSQRVAILSTAVFFVAGLVGMATVDEKRGHDAAVAWSKVGETAAGEAPIA